MSTNFAQNWDRCLKESKNPFPLVEQEVICLGTLGYMCITGYKFKSTMNYLFLLHKEFKYSKNVTTIPIGAYQTPPAIANLWNRDHFCGRREKKYPEELGQCPQVGARDKCEIKLKFIYASDSVCASVCTAYARRIECAHLNVLVEALMIAVPRGTPNVGRLRPVGGQVLARTNDCVKLFVGSTGFQLLTRGSSPAEWNIMQIVRPVIHNM